MDVFYNNVNEYNSIRKWKTLIVFYDKIAVISKNKKSQIIIKDLFIRKLNISAVFITVSFFCSKRSQIKFCTLSNNQDL